MKAEHIDKLLESLTKKLYRQNQKLLDEQDHITALKEHAADLDHDTKLLIRASMDKLIHKTCSLKEQIAITEAHIQALQQAPID